MKGKQGKSWGVHSSYLTAKWLRTQEAKRFIGFEGQGTKRSGDPITYDRLVEIAHW
jgi:hypothetical protein